MVELGEVQEEVVEVDQPGYFEALSDQI